MLSALLINGLNGIIFPVFFACVTLSVVGNLTDTVNLTGLRKFLLSFCNWLLGLGFGVFCTFIGGHGLVASGIDNASVKATKFALSSYVPILGGYLSEGFDVVLAGSLLIKNTVGITGIFVVISIVLLPLVRLIVFSLAVKLTSGVVQVVGDDKVSGMLDGVGSAVSMLISLLLGTAFVFFFVMILMVYTVNAGVL